jgi:glutathione S-transferase
MNAIFPTKLYSMIGTCSLFPHILLRELEIPFELEQVDVRVDKYSGGELSELNEKGYIPVLELSDGSRLTECPAIAQFLADLKPEAHLIPASGTFERYRCVEWMSFISMELQAAFRPFFQDTTDAEKTRAADVLRLRFEFVNKRLAGNNYLLGEKYSVADMHLFVMTGWMKKMKIPASDLLNLDAWQKRIQERPAVQKAIGSEPALPLL